MRIALVNLPFDCNYGGNLQRYALVKVLTDLGHDVEHLFLLYRSHIPWYKKPYIYAKRLASRILGKGYVPFNLEAINNRMADERDSVALSFYNRYIPHTSVITDRNELSRFAKGYDAFIVGSDQVWRKKIVGFFGLSTFFLDFVTDSRIKKIAYAISFGTDKNELSPREISKLGMFYRSFNQVSVREDSGLDLLQDYHWNNPYPIQCLDPTLLLSKRDYEQLIEAVDTHMMSGNMFCYVLDLTQDIEKRIQLIAEEKGLIPYIMSTDIVEVKISIEQWLRCFRDAEYVVTDSFHGLVFSYIFEKPHLALANSFRGNARMESLERIFLHQQTLRLADYEPYIKLKEESLHFLKQIDNLV